MPTEEEWEKAASWEKTKKEKRVCSWGNDYDASKCYAYESGVGGTTPVGKYSLLGDSPYDAGDMTSDEWEWCMDWYAEDYFKNSSARNQPGPSSEKYRLLRGGFWSNSQIYVRCAYRSGDVLYSFRAAISIDLTVGFRVASSGSISES